MKYKKQSITLYDELNDEFLELTSEKEKAAMAKLDKLLLGNLKKKINQTKKELKDDIKPNKESKFYFGFPSYNDNLTVVGPFFKYKKRGIK